VAKPLAITRSAAVATLLVLIAVTGCDRSVRGLSPTVSLNEAVNVGTFAFTVTKVAFGERNLGYLTAQGDFILVDIMVKNIGGDPRSVYCQDQKLKDLSGRTYDDAVDVGDRDDLINIAPGNQVRFTCAFDVSKGALPAAVEVHESQYSEGATVTVLSRR